MRELAAFSLKTLQEALTVRRVMERHGITPEELKEYLKTTHPALHGTGVDSGIFPGQKRVRRLSRKQREREFARTKWGRRRR